MDVDDTLVLILERVDSSVSLIRAASTCRRWRRIIAAAGFLRRFRSLHGPPVAGDYYNNDNRVHDGTNIPSFVPSSSSINARHFSLDFVAGVSELFKSLGRKWGIDPSCYVRDSRGSLLLMDFSPDRFLSGSFPNLVVCEPLTRRYRIIPRPPNNINFPYCFCEYAYLVDGDEDEAGGRIGMSNFRVLGVFLCCEDLSRREEEVAYTTVFTAGSVETYSTWSEMAIDHIALRLAHRDVIYLGHTLGSSYHYGQQDSTVITHDGRTGKFSSSMAFSFDVKRHWDGYKCTQNMAVVDGGDGEPRIIGMTDHHTLEVFARVDGQWGLEKKVLLTKATRGLAGYRLSFFDKPLTIMRRGAGFVVIAPRGEPNKQWAFSVDLKTMEVAPTTKGNDKMAYPCEFPWPPVFHVCLDI